jgi:hypothetical protein
MTRTLTGALTSAGSILKIWRGLAAPKLDATLTSSAVTTLTISDSAVTALVIVDTAV